MIATQSFGPSEQVPGKKLLLAIGAAILASALVGTASYYLLRSTIGNRTSVTAQIVTLLVYFTLTLILCAFFRPPTNYPISLRFTGMKHAVAAIGTWAATVAAIVLVY